MKLGQQKISYVGERERVKSAKKDADGNVVTVMESIGWWIMFEDGWSIGVGPTQPDLKAGDTVNLSLEKVE